MTDLQSLLTFWETGAREIEQDNNRTEAEDAVGDTLRRCAEEVRGLLDPERLERIADYVESNQGSLPPGLGGDSAKQDAAYLRSLAGRSSTQPSTTSKPLTKEAASAASRSERSSA